MEEIKPSESDANEEETTGEQAAPNSDSSQAGTEDDTNIKAGFKDRLEEISGREFKSEEDAIKHYENLASYVGKKKEETAEENPTVAPSEKPKSNVLTDRLDRFEFISENPEAKEHFEEYVKPLSQAKGVPLAQAWEQIKPLIDAKKEQEDEKEIGISSKNRVQPTSNTDLKELRKKAQTGDIASQEAMVMAELEGKM